MARETIIHTFMFVGLLVTFTSAHSTESCQYSPGVRGMCRDIRQCPTVIRDLRNRVRTPVSCGTFNGRYPNVCCPAGDGSSGSLPKQIILTDPQPDLDCGSPFPISTPEGIRLRSLIGTEELIGAINSFLNAWPWMALLGFRESPDSIDWFCAGSLINNEWILTAAHCFDKRTVNAIRLGEYNHADPNDGAQTLDLGVSAPVIFPNYTFPQAYHDLALLKLERRVTFQDAIRPVCLPWGHESNRVLDGQEVTVTGWGNTLNGGNPSNTLQEVKVTVFPSSDCDSSYRGISSYPLNWPQGISSESICAGDREGGKDACQGDSGGPMVSKDSRGRFTIFGVVSFGYGCGARSFPGLYVNLRRPEYLDWIRRVAFSK